MLTSLETGLNISTLILGLAVVTVIYRLILYPSIISPLSRIPKAHWSAPFSPLWILWVRYTNRENLVVHAAHLAHGEVVRLGPNEISISSIDGGIRTVYGGGFEKGKWYSIFDNYGVPCMFSSLHSRTHSARKRMITNVYSKSSIHGSPALASQARTILFSRLLPTIFSSTHISQIPHGIDVHDLWFATTMDFITAYQFGLTHASNFLMDVAYRQHWLDLYQSRKIYTFFWQELPRLTKFMKLLGIRLVPSWVDLANRELEAWCANLCAVATPSAMLDSQSFHANPGDEPIVLSSLLCGIDKEREFRGSDSVLRDTTLKETELSVASEMLDHLAAGHETSGITLTYLSWHLSQDLALQKALRKELLTLENAMIYSPPVGIDVNSWLDEIQLPDPKLLDKLPLLNAVIMETLRLKAAIPGGQPRMTPYPSSVIGGYEVPGGIRVGGAAWTLHRNANVYPSPNTWDHTRWLEDTDGKEKATGLRDRDRNFWAFSSGGRMCIGSNFAMYELKLIVAAVYTNFTTHIVNDEGIEQEDGYTCGPKSNRLILRFEGVHL